MTLFPKKLITISVTLIVLCGTLSGVDKVFGKTRKRKIASSSIAETLKAIVDSSGLAKSDLGLLVLTEDGEEVYSLNSEKKFNPASVTKIIPAVTVLDTWNSAFQFNTEIYSKNEVHEEKILGPVYLKGGGDPAFVSEQMWNLVNNFSRFDVKSIEGDIVVDESRFDSVRFDIGRLPPREGHAFEGPGGALSFNWNAVNVFVKPDTKVGAPLLVHLDPKTEYLAEVHNSGKTSRSGGSLNVSIIPLKNGGEIVGDRVSVSGTLSNGTKEQIVYRTISEPDLWTGAAFVHFLKQRGISVHGKVVRGNVPSDAHLLVRYPGANVRDLVTDMMKWSNNFVAEMLTKNLAVEAGQKQGTMSGGLEILRQELDKVGVARGEYNLISPSGLTRENRLTPKLFGKLLSYAISKSNIFPEFLAALPIGGTDGTLKGRLKGTSIRAKTGSMDGVTAVSGFAFKSKEENYIFVFIYNGSKTSGAKNTLDELAVALVDK